MSKSTTMVKTGDWIMRDGKHYEVIIADKRLFVACPMSGGVTNYEQASVYSNNPTVLTLDEMKMLKCTPKQGDNHG